MSIEEQALRILGMLCIIIPMVVVILVIAKGMIDNARDLKEDRRREDDDPL